VKHFNQITILIASKSFMEFKQMHKHKKNYICHVIGYSWVCLLSLPLL